jgi:hypothetical protein
MDMAMCDDDNQIMEECCDFDDAGGMESYGFAKSAAN